MATEKELIKIAVEQEVVTQHWQMVAHLLALQLTLRNYEFGERLSLREIVEKAQKEVLDLVIAEAFDGV